ncbi:hypothetical protein HII31_13338 [Pseudocercospora fuligena]|uniref:NACHT domain-containing protein n=1 Tax=Pseudocercospora fuligena TaxID=685502 RepID=A0A8H6R6L9_9PEZI|nr:hypothetical protein HII31_13338 [Pseudocercospora fuligena]
MGGTLSVRSQPNTTQNYASSGAFQHNGDAYIGNTFNYNTARDEELHGLVNRVEKAVLSDQVNDTTLRKAIVASLAFPEMNTRRQTIPDAAYSTFAWLLKDFDRSKEQLKSDLPDQWQTDGNIFRRWLEESYATDLFWVSGKPGSGKSTFMKYICEQSETRNILQNWAGERRLCLSPHFFWHTGSPLQRSMQGLLQTILHQICEYDNSLVPTLFPQRWQQSNIVTNRHWSSAELLIALRNLQKIPDTAFCIFVDGLDEFHPSDDHHEIAHELLRLAAIPNVKVCVSSRPWEAFRTSFQDHLAHQALEMHLLTKRDLYEYVSKRLQTVTSRANFDETDLDKIAQEMVKKAEGVFLWLRLVLSRVRDRMSLGFDSQQLMQCVAKFPAELGVYLREMIYERISPTWKGAETARCLKLAMMLNQSSIFRSMRYKDVLLYMIAVNEEDLDSDLVSQMEVQFVHDGVIQRTKRVIESSCEGLLHVHDGVVQFTHRTVYDFLLTADMAEIVDTNVPNWMMHPKAVLHLLLARCRVIPGAPGDSVYPLQHELILSLSTQIFKQALSDRDWNSVRILETAVVDLDRKFPLPQILFNAEKAIGPETSTNPVFQLIARFMRCGLYKYMKEVVSREPHLAWGHNPIEVAHNGLAVDLSALHDAISFLVSKGLDARTLADSWSGFLRTPAATHDHDCISRLLLESGVEPELVFTDPQTSATKGAPAHLLVDAAAREQAHQSRLAYRAKFWPQIRDGDSFVFLVWSFGKEVYTICPPDEVLHSFPKKEDVDKYEPHKFLVRCETWLYRVRDRTPGRERELHEGTTYHWAPFNDPKIWAAGSTRLRKEV